MIYGGVQSQPLISTAAARVFRAFCAVIRSIPMVLSNLHESAGRLHKCTDIVLSEGAYSICIFQLIANPASGEAAKVETIPGLNSQP